MTDAPDCLSCANAVPARAPDGSVDFRIKNCIANPPTPVPVMGPNGQPMMGSFFPTVGKGVYCKQWASKLSIAERLEGRPLCSAYSSLIQDGNCRNCGFPKAAHDAIREVAP